jgi:hypothetical protein
MRYRNYREYEEKIRRLSLPESTDDKIVYFLWLDDQVMELWAEYLTMKCQAGVIEPIDLSLNDRMNSKLELIEYFEMYLDAIRLHVTYNQIDEWVTTHDYSKKFIYNRF